MNILQYLMLGMSAVVICHCFSATTSALTDCCLVPLSGSQTSSEPSGGCLTGRRQHLLNAANLGYDALRQHAGENIANLLFVSVSTAKVEENYGEIGN